MNLWLFMKGTHCETRGEISEGVGRDFGEGDGIAQFLWNCNRKQNKQPSSKETSRPGRSHWWILANIWRRSMNICRESFKQYFLFYKVSVVRIPQRSYEEILQRKVQIFLTYTDTYKTHILHGTRAHWMQCYIKRILQEKFFIYRILVYLKVGEVASVWCFIP